MKNDEIVEKKTKNDEVLEGKNLPELVGSKDDIRTAEFLRKKFIGLDAKKMAVDVFDELQGIVFEYDPGNKKGMWTFLMEASSPVIEQAMKEAVGYTNSLRSEILKTVTSADEWISLCMKPFYHGYHDFVTKGGVGFHVEDIELQQVHIDTHDSPHAAAALLKKFVKAAEEKLGKSKESKKEEPKASKKAQGTGKKVKKVIKGRIPKKPKEKRLNKRITAATTEKMKEDVKEVAKEEDESVSKFVRDILIDEVASNSVKDDVYMDTHGDLPVGQLVESGHEPDIDFVESSEGEEKKGGRIKAKKKVSKNKRARSKAQRKMSSAFDENTVDVKVLKKNLSYLRKVKLKVTKDMMVGMQDAYDKMNVVKVDFTESSLRLFVSTESLHVFVTLKQFHGNLSMVFGIDELYKIFSVTDASTAKFEVIENGKVKITFDNGYDVDVRQSLEPQVLHMWRFGNFDTDSYDTDILTVRPKTLLEIFKGVEYTMGDAELHLDGVEIDRNKHDVVFMSSDGFRMSYMSFPKVPYVESEENIPFKSTKAFFQDRGVRVMMAILKGQKESVKVGLCEGKVGFLVDKGDVEIEVVNNNSNHQYTDFQKVIDRVDRDKVAVIEVNAKMLYNSVKSLSSTFPHKDVVVKMSFERDSNELTLLAGEVYESTLSLPMKMIDMKSEIKSFEIGFNSRFLMQTLKLWSSDEFYTDNSDGKIRMRFTGQRGPMKMHPVSDDNVFLVLMPVEL